MIRSLKIAFVIAGLSVSPLGAGEAKLVEVKELGYSMNKPDNWHFYQKLKKPLGHEQPTVEALIAHYARTPVAAISKFPAEYVKDVNPNIRVTLKPVKNTTKKKSVVSKDPERLLSGIVVGLKPVLQNFKKDGEVEALNLSGNHAAFVRISYTMQMIDGTQTRGNSDIWLVMPRADYAFLISAVTREDQSNATRKELKTIVETIKMKTLEN